MFSQIKSLRLNWCWFWPFLSCHLIIVFYVQSNLCVFFNNYQPESYKLVTLILHCFWIFQNIFIFSTADQAFFMSSLPFFPLVCNCHVCPYIYNKSKWLWAAGCFHKIFGGGTCFRGTIFGPRQGRVKWIDSCRGQGQMRGDLEKLSVEAKNALLQQNESKFWCFKHKIELSDAVLS